MNEEYYFLFLLGLIWVFFASVCDLRKREVPNWLSFSLIVFALSYRAFFSSLNDNWAFFGFGALGFVVLFCVANVMYRARAFGGGDAKLLMGVGIILPIESFRGMLYEISGFLILLFLIGLIYTLFYSIGLVMSNRKKFYQDFAGFMNKYLFAFGLLIFAGLILFVPLYILKLYFLAVMIAALFILVPFLYFYLKSVERVFLTKMIKPSKLTEGDWLAQTIHMRGRTIRKRAFGLTPDEIIFLRKIKKKVLIKYGIPFVPAFFFALIVMVFFYLVLGADFSAFFSWIF